MGALFIGIGGHYTDQTAFAPTLDLTHIFQVRGQFGQTVIPPPKGAQLPRRAGSTWLSSLFGVIAFSPRPKLGLFAHFPFAVGRLGGALTSLPYISPLPSEDHPTFASHLPNGMSPANTYSQHKMNARHGETACSYMSWLKRVRPRR